MTMIKKKIVCTHSKENILQYLISPLDTNVPGFVRLVDYFEYKAPMIDSVHSQGNSISKEQQQELLDTMLSESNMISRSRFLERIQKNSLKDFNLEGDEICIKCPRMICRIGKDETEFKALLRHLRNGFAHGRTYVKKTKNQTYVIIEDLDKKKQCSAKIVITKAILNRWYKTIKTINVI